MCLVLICSEDKFFRFYLEVKFIKSIGYVFKWRVKFFNYRKNLFYERKLYYCK